MTKHRQQSTRVRANRRDPIWNQVCSSVYQFCFQMLTYLELVNDVRGNKQG